MDITECHIASHTQCCVIESMLCDVIASPQARPATIENYLWREIVSRFADRKKSTALMTSIARHQGTVGSLRKSVRTKARYSTRAEKTQNDRFSYFAEIVWRVRCPSQSTVDS